MTRALQDEETFLLEHGWCSCYDCDIIFTDIEELEKHLQIHAREQEILLNSG